MPRRYFSEIKKQQRHYASHHYPQTPEAMFEAKVESFFSTILRSIFWIPRRFVKAIKNKDHFPKV